MIPVAPASPYHAAKGGVVNLTRGLAAEWGKYNICIKKIFQNNSSSLSFMAKSFGSTNESSVQLPNKTKKRDLPLRKITLDFYTNAQSIY